MDQVEKFTLGPGRYKYTAILKNGRHVNFGHRDYQHYQDTVPKNKGGQKWSHLDHLNPDRRKRYQQRHSGIINKNGQYAYKVKYSPAWFSYRYLW